MSRKLFVSSAFFLALASSTAFATQTVEWSNATATGNGCPKDSAVVTITPGGDEIAWTFSEFGFDLANVSSAARFCRLSASAKIAGGFYLAELTQELTYGGIKSQWGSRLEVGAQSRFFGHSLKPLRHVYEDGEAFSSGFESARSVQDFAVLAPPHKFCRNSNPVGLFQSTVSAVGQVLWDGASASLAVQGQNVSFRATAGWAACPL